MSFNARFDLPDAYYYDTMENFECPYDHQCEDCEYDCEEEDDED